MKTIYTTEIFDGWFDALRDKQAARRILDLARQLKE
jgi:putative component of toxin-antitoxin plasmid stabilization module